MRTTPGITLEGEEPYIKVFIEMNAAPPSLEDYDVELLSRAGNVYVARLPVANLGAVASLPEVVRMEGDAWVKPLLNQSIPEIGADRVWKELGDETGRSLRGFGVIAGMVDTGIYSGHKNFREGDTGDSRILYVWDHKDGRGPAPEETCRDYLWDPPRSVQCEGTECSPRYEGCDVEDEAMHGTWVMGVMAGNGRSKPKDCGAGCIGVAPQADMVVVGLGEGLASEVIQGVDYIFQKAAALGRPAVVNLSVGWYPGSRDGNSLLERHLSGLLRDSGGSLIPGRIIVAAAGNDALEMGHARAIVSGGEERRTLFIDCGPSLGDWVQVYGWYDGPSGGGGVEVRVAKSNVGTSWVGFEQPAESVDSRLGRITIEHSQRSGKARGFTITLDSGTSRLRNDNWFIDMRGVGLEQAVTVDLWVERTLLVGSSASCQRPARFLKAHAVAASTIAPACTANDVICVASYITRCLDGACTGCSLDYGSVNCKPGGEAEGDISSFSSLGPRRDGGKEPALAAPGHLILTPGPEGQDDYWYVAGTSFSAPHVAGTVALMLQANPSLTVAEVRQALVSSACDPQAEECTPASNWNDAWGWGKLDAFGAVAQVGTELPPPQPHGLGHEDDTCFIATAVFGGIDAPQVERLRALRDKFLLRTSLGRGFVRSYYQWSPPVAAWLKEQAMLSRMARLSLMPLVGVSEMACHRSTVKGLVLCLFGVFLLSAVCYSSLKRRIR
jgi:subtilisin family serine protease